MPYAISQRELERKISEGTRNMPNIGAGLARLSQQTIIHLMVDTDNIPRTDSIDERSMPRYCNFACTLPPIRFGPGNSRVPVSDKDFRLNLVVGKSISWNGAPLNNSNDYVAIRGINYVEGVKPFAEDNIRASPSGFIFGIDVVNLSSMWDRELPRPRPDQGIRNKKPPNPDPPSPGNEDPFGRKTLPRPGGATRPGPDLSNLPGRFRYTCYEITFDVYKGGYDLNNPRNNLFGTYKIEKRFPVSNNH